jgi:hypothetical protein
VNGRTTRIDEVCAGIYRISSFAAATVSFNQFLIDDAQSALITPASTQCTSRYAPRSPRCSTRPGSPT